MKSLHEKIVEIQQADQRTKVRWVIGCSVISALLVIGIWITYVNTIMSNTQFASIISAQDNEPGILKTLVAGTEGVLDAIRQRTANTILYFQKRASKTNDLYIKVN